MAPDRPATSHQSVSFDGSLVAAAIGSVSVAGASWCLGKSDDRGGRLKPAVLSSSAAWRWRLAFVDGAALRRHLVVVCSTSSGRAVVEPFGVRDLRRPVVADLAWVVHRVPVEALELARGERRRRAPGWCTPSPSSSRISNLAPPTIWSSSRFLVPWSSTFVTMIGGYARLRKNGAGRGRTLRGPDAP